MARIINQVAVFGLGKVGELVAVMLGESGFKVIGYDAAPRDLPHTRSDFEVRPLDVKDDAACASRCAESTRSSRACPTT